MDNVDNALNNNTYL